MSEIGGFADVSGSLGATGDVEVFAVGDLVLVQRLSHDVCGTDPARLSGTPTPAPLVCDDPAWLYGGWHGSLATRRLRVWQTGPGRVVAVVTQTPDAPGTEHHHTAEQIVAVRAEYGRCG
jgi:hypothetical protein